MAIDAVLEDAVLGFAVGAWLIGVSVLGVCVGGGAPSVWFWVTKIFGPSIDDAMLPMLPFGGADGAPLPNGSTEPKVPDGLDGVVLEMAVLLDTAVSEADPLDPPSLG